MKEICLPYTFVYYIYILYIYIYKLNGTHKHWPYVFVVPAFGALLGNLPSNHLPVCWSFASLGVLPLLQRKQIPGDLETTKKPTGTDSCTPLCSKNTHTNKHGKARSKYINRRNLRLNHHLIPPFPFAFYVFLPGKTNRLPLALSPICPPLMAQFLPLLLQQLRSSPWINVSQGFCNSPVL